MIHQTKQTILQAQNLRIGYAGRKGVPKIVADNINVDLESGELACLLGPNGSGKSTLIKTLAGMQPLLDGDVLLFDETIRRLTPKDTAQKLSTVLTDPVTIGNIDVETLVSFGRSPYTGWLGNLRDEDRDVIHWAIEATGLQPLAHRDISTLSDGERQKVMIARALAQDTDLILLDEPTAHLDLPNRVEIMRLLRQLAQETGKAILLSTHELDLALKAADTVWLIDSETGLISGSPEDLVLDGTFETVFERDSFDFDRATGSFNLHERAGQPVKVGGDAIAGFWTRRALEREGYRVVTDQHADWSVRVTPDNSGYRWTVTWPGKEKQHYGSVKELVEGIKKITENTN